MRQPHVLPLSAEALAILRRRWPLPESNESLVFSTKGTKPLSDMTMAKVLRDLGLLKITVHGFRSSFTDWAAEQTEFPKEVVDKALAHKLVDRVEAAYRRLTSSSGGGGSWRIGRNSSSRKRLLVWLRSQASAGIAFAIRQLSSGVSALPFSLPPVCRQRSENSSFARLPSPQRPLRCSPSATCH